MAQSLAAAEAAVSRPAADPKRWWALIATCFGLFMALLDVTIVNVALPTIGNDLKASFADLQWVINAYTLVLAVLLVTAGRLGDVFGRKSLFMLSLGIFSVGSLLCALSGDISLGGLSHIQVLIAARVVQGLGGAGMLPLALAIIAATFQGRERGIAIGIYGGVTGLATAIGPVIGGVLVQNVSWQSIFYLNVPIGFIGIAMCAWAVTESRDTHATRSVDVFGLVTLTISLVCLVLALIQGNDSDKGWTSPYILTLFGVAALALIIFVVGELRLKNPMVDPRLFTNISFTGSAIAAFALSGGLYALFFFLSLYLQNYLGFSALDAGLRVLPLSALTVLAAPIVGVIAQRTGAKLVMALGLVIGAAGVLSLARISATDTQSSWTVLLPGFILGGIASGMVSPQISTVAVNTVNRERSGMASGISGVCRQLGTAFGIAFLGALLTNRYDTELHDKISALSVPNVPAAQQKPILDGVISGLQKAGTFVGSTGLKNPPAQYAHNPLLPQIQTAVSQSFIDGTTFILVLAAGLLAIGALASFFFIRQRDMTHANADAAPLEL